MKNPATHQAPDSATGAGDGDTEVSRTKIAQRDWIDKGGSPVDEEVATGAQYTFLADGKSATFEPVTDHAATRMLAIFGALTLMGNLTNTWKTEKGDRADSPIDVISERFGLLADGKWIDRAAGVVGARVDKDALVAAYVEYAASKGQTKDPVAVLEKITDKPSLIRDLRSIPEVLAGYVRRTGAKGKTAEEVLGAV